jgi:DNA-binding transcriptional LysR family regulator
VEIQLFEHRHADELAAAMAAGEADVAVGPAPDGWAGPVRKLGVEDFVVVLPADDPITGTRIALDRLADRSWVHYAPSNGLADVLDHACAAAGFRPRAAVRTEQTAAAPLLAAAGLGPALVPANILPATFDARVLRPSPPIRRTLTAYTRQPDPMTTAFIDVLSEHAKVR